MIIRTERQMKEMQDLGIIARAGLQILLSMVEQGITPKIIDDFAKDFFEANNVKSAPIEAYKFPGQTCISVNNVIAHGIPDNTPFKNGDMVNIDLSITRNNHWIDTGMSVVCGVASEKQKHLLKATRLARRAAIEAAVPGAKLVEIAQAVEKVAQRNGLTVIENIGGHGVGNFIHEEPFISNAVKNAQHGVLVKNQVIAIEPILSYGDSEVVRQGPWHLVSSEQSAQAEHTIIVGTPSKIIT
jgi:methionyl aminopeptidase